MFSGRIFLIRQWNWPVAEGRSLGLELSLSFSLSPRGKAQSAPDYEVYYEEVKTGLAGSFFRDSGLEPDTVYIYRIKSCVESDCSIWSNESAGKTLVSRNERPIVNKDDGENSMAGLFCSLGQGAETPI